MGRNANREKRVSHCGCDSGTAQQLERRTLCVLLLINATLFVAEAGVAWIAQSTGLLADSLDMLADAIVYGTAFYASVRSFKLQRHAAFASGIVQIALGVGVLLEVVRRCLLGSDPISTLMIAMGCVALVANVLCLFLLAKHRKGGVHMRASWIFSTNDVLANVGVILSGVSVRLLSSPVPDLLIGGIISLVVVFGGFRIIRHACESDAMSG